MRFVRQQGGSTVKGAMAVVGFPTAGLAGSIACRYLVETLHMDVLGYFDAPDFDPSVCVEGGRVSPCLRAFCTAASCGPDGRCEQLVVILTDVTPQGQDLRRIARGILHWAVGRKLDSLIAIEGYPKSLTKDGTETPDINTGRNPRTFSMANRDGQALLRHRKAEPMDGLATGFSAALLLEGSTIRFPTATLVVETQVDGPDARAAAVVVESLSGLVPQLNLDPVPLRIRAELLEATVRRSRSELARAKALMAVPSDASMYR